MFKKGISGNPQGRKPGSKDKAQADIKQAYQSLIEGNLSNIENWLNEVAAKDPGKALDFMLRLSDFILPKMKAVELQSDFGQPIQQIIVRDQKTAELLLKLG